MKIFGLRLPIKQQKTRCKGINNIINIDRDNNIIKISKNSDIYSKAKININICGNNNTIIIDEAGSVNINIDIGNYTGVNNVEINIGKNLYCVGADIFAYQHNVPISIGENCLLSKNITIRSGELPHSIYDMNTCKDFDHSEGILIGNHVWLGEHSYILKKAKISDDSVVGAMSVVTKEFNEKNVVIAGNPAKICKRNVMWNADWHFRPKEII